MRTGINRTHNSGRAALLATAVASAQRGGWRRGAGAQAGQARGGAAADGEQPLAAAR